MSGSMNVRKKENTETVNGSPRSRLLLSSIVIILVASLMYVWAGKMTEDEKPENVELKTTPDVGVPSSMLTSSPMEEEPTAQLPGLDPTQSPAIDEASPTTSEQCSDICDKREKNRNDKFGGDLLNPQDVLRLAKKAKETTIGKLREDYGEYFEKIFVKTPEEGKSNPYGEVSYNALGGMDRNGPSRGRLKRKFKLKILKMMRRVRTTERNVNGCDCVDGTGTPERALDEKDDVFETPDYYEKYVFANGGHSQSAGHGNKFSESYTEYFKRDVHRVFKAIGVELFARNMAMGAMKASPDIATCSKEIFGADVDFLTWNYAMTDGHFDSITYYMYRGAINPGRPALAIMTWNKARFVGNPLEDMGLAMFSMQTGDSVMRAIPDSEPNGIPLADSELNKLPKYVKNMKCNRKIGGKVACDGAKWSCTRSLQESGVDCTCPNVGARSSWHMGYQMHALHGHLLSLPFLEMLIEALHELAESTEDIELLLEKLQKEEDEELEAFLAKPILNDHNFKIDKQFAALGPMDGELMNLWFKGPNICRTTLLPAMSRFLGLTTNTDATGESARCGEETYETGIPFDRNRGDYVYGNQTPVPGELNIMAANDFRSCFTEEECPEIIMPDYKDWYMASWKDGKASITFPNEKEKAHYGYEKGKFKGVLGIVPTIFAENYRELDGPRDIPLQKFQDHIKLTVNGKPVMQYKAFNHMAILEDEHGSVYWEPSANLDYVLEFEPVGTIDGKPASDKHFRLQGFVLY